MRKNNRIKRHFTIRKRVTGTPECLRLNVFRSNNYIYAQIINDAEGKTLLAESDLKMDKKIKKAERSLIVGEKLAEKALKKGIKKVVFDRGGFLYHGRVAKIAEGARKGGLQF